MKNNTSEKRINRQTTLSGLLLIIVAAATLAATSFIQYYFAEKGLRDEATTRAKSQLKATRNQIMDIVNQTESAVRNSVWIAAWCLDYPDSLDRVAKRLVRDNPVVIGSTVAVVPDYYKRRPLFAPYAFRADSGEFILKSLATEEYDYPSQEWFAKPLKSGEGYWSEPYVDEGGGEVLMTTYSLPIRDAEGNIAAILTADVSLEWLKEYVGSLRVYPNAFCLMFSRNGNIMVGPPQVEIDSSKVLTYDSPVERTGWSISTVIPEEDIYGGMRKIGSLVFILQIVGLLLIIFMLRSFIKGETRFRALDQQRQRYEGEMKVATGIQMSMVPKTFPPFPERHDLDMAATIVPAKQVGGDLYDFFIRDEKLFFCVGDVSGKGIPAALVMAVTRTTFRNLSANETSPGCIVKAMNDNLSAMNESNMFVTFFCGVLDLAKGTLRYCNAGHNPPLVLTDQMRFLEVEANLPLGILQGMEFKEQVIPFHYDDAIFIYTDGLTEAENVNHELFGEDRLKLALSGRKGANEHLDNIKKKVADFVGEAPQSDDLTILFIRYLPATRRLTLHNDISQIALLPDFIEEAVKASKLDPCLTASLNLAIEEAATNVIQYAYPNGTFGDLTIDAAITDNALTFILTDKGKPFDPTAKAEVDTSASVEDRPIGGLGIHLVRKIMDSVRYDRIDDKNVLILTKKYI